MLYSMSPTYRYVIWDSSCIVCIKKYGNTFYKLEIYTYILISSRNQNRNYFLFENEKLNNEIAYFHTGRSSCQRRQWIGIILKDNLQLMYLLVEHFALFYKASHQQTIQKCLHAFNSKMYFCPTHSFSVCLGKWNHYHTPCLILIHYVPFWLMKISNCKWEN